MVILNGAFINVVYRGEAGFFEQRPDIDARRVPYAALTPFGIRRFISASMLHFERAIDFPEACVHGLPYSFKLSFALFRFSWAIP